MLKMSIGIIFLPTLMSLDLSKVNFGKAAAENEREALPNYFVSTRAYLNAKDEHRKKLFYIGHRGSGKSALFTQLAHEYAESPQNIVLQITPADYSYDTFKKLQHDFYDIRSAYTLAWYYTLVIQVLSAVLAHFHKKRLLKKHKENLEVIEGFLKENGFLGPKSGLEVFIFFLSRIAISRLRIKMDKLELEGDFATKQYMKLVNMEGLKGPLNSLKNILHTYTIFMFIDELDTGWNNTNEAINFVSGLISASIKLNAEKGLNIFVSLRQDMYNNLAEVFRDTEKIRGDIERLKWDYKSLQALIAQRIRNCAEVKRHYSHLPYLPNSDLINLIFEEGVFEYLVKHTLYRPREVIHFCTLALENFVETYIERRRFDKRIDLEAAKAVEQRFSMERLEDFCKEYEDELPSIREFLSNFEGRNSRFSREQFIDELGNILLELLDRDLSWVKEFIEKPHKLLEKLFHIGFVKISLSENGHFFAYYERIPLNFRNVKFVQINDMFLPGLQCE